MLAARDELLGGGAYDRLMEAVADATAAAAPGRAAGGWLADLGCGTGHYLARALGRLPGWRGLALDASPRAVRHAMNAHPAVAGVACDLWRTLPLRDGAADVALDVFAPRHGAEYARAVADDGALIVVTPAPDHLAELAALPGMPRVDPDKDRRLDAELGARWRRRERRDVAYGTEMDSGALRAVVAMGPGAHHVASGALDRALGEGGRVVTVSARIDTFVARV